MIRYDSHFIVSPSHNSLTKVILIFRASKHNRRLGIRIVTYFTQMQAGSFLS